jgi:hypothetical protein
MKGKFNKHNLIEGKVIDSHGKLLMEGKFEGNLSSLKLKV